MSEPFVDCDKCGTDGFIINNNNILVICPNCNGKGFLVLE